MSLEPGARLGAYEVLRLLGAGGMGEVYQARDTRLDRLVAIKVLRGDLADADDRRQRLEREARAVAALNHPHICDLHDVAEHDRIRFLVMEYLEGQTLADRLVRGALPPADVLRYAIELADALDHAHRRGLVHRDVKPGNVMLTDSGTKLLDFSLSKQRPTPDLIGLSTIGSGQTPLTAPGAVLGTYPYMSPEQLQGQEADVRSDIFGFGALVYEMATGRRAFQGSSAASVIGAILHTDPPLVSAVHPLSPPALDHVVSRCLAKDPNDRWQTARDLMLELKWVGDRTADPVDARRKKTRPGLLRATAFAMVAIAATATALMVWLRPRAAERTVRLAFAPPAGLTLAEVRTAGPVTISPDGLRVAYVAAASDGQPFLWVQPLDSVVAQPLSGTQDAAYPFWSPDSRSIGFFGNGRLNRIDTAGGPPQHLCDVVLPRGGTWSRAGVIVFSASAGQHLYQVPAAGGVPAALTFPRQHRDSLWPSFLPDGRHFVYFGRRTDPGIYVASLEPTAPAKLLVSGLYTGAIYASGYLMFVKGGSMGGTLFAQPIDLDRVELTAGPVALAEAIPFYPNFGRADFSVSETGTAIFGKLVEDPTSLIWFDRAGRILADVPGATGYRKAALSHDGKTIGAQRVDPVTQSQDVWLIDPVRGAASRLTTNPGLDNMGVWSPDGRHIIYGSTRDDQGLNTYIKAVSGNGAEASLFASGERELQQTLDWSNKVIVFARLDAKMQWDLWTMPELREPGDAVQPATLYLQTEFNEHDGVLSPDGKWMAYSSDQSGRWEVYVDAFPERRTRGQQVSTSGGMWPEWRRDGKELFYRSADQTLMAVAISSVSDLSTGPPRGLFKLRSNARGVRNERPFAAARDGQRFLVNVTREAVPSSVSVVINWPAGLSRR